MTETTYSKEPREEQLFLSTSFLPKLIQANLQLQKTPAEKKA